MRYKQEADAMKRLKDVGIQVLVVLSDFVGYDSC